MPTIDIRRDHALSLKAARAVVERVAIVIGKEYGIDHHWDGHTLHFERSGVDGHIAIAKREIHVHARLGLLMGMMTPVIEREIERRLDAELG